MEDNYAQCEQRRDGQLLHEADIYQLLMYRDGATINKIPYVNILASSINNPAAVMEIVDCTEQLEDGGIKDAEYSAELLLPHMQKLDPQIDVVNFDGGSNFQKATKAVRKVYPRVEVVHAAEHVLSLYFKDIILLHPMLENVVNFYKLLYCIFGGSHHNIFATFKKYSIVHNAIAVGLLRPADTQMAGYIIALLRLIRLRPVFASLLASPEYTNLKIDTRVTTVLNNKCFWRFLVEICAANMGNLAILQKYDQKCACSDELLFYVHKVDAHLQANTKVLNKYDEITRYDDMHELNLDLSLALKKKDDALLDGRATEDQL